MIIKSLGRKASGKLTGDGTGKNPFMKLVQYMTRSGSEEKSQSVLWHGFYGHDGLSNEEIVAAFEENAKRLRARKNGNVLYHEILSFSAGYSLRGEALTRAVADIGQEYLRNRAPNQLAFGAIHFDTDHIHLHLMVSANAIGKRDREWLTKEQFAGLQKAIEAFTLAKYPELGQTPLYDRARKRERLKTQAHEQAMKARTGEPSRKERIKAKLHGLFEQASSLEDLEARLIAEGLAFYLRGKSRGVIEQLADGSGRRHRLATLGLDTHFDATVARFARQAEHQEEPRMNTVPPEPPSPDTEQKAEREPSDIEVVEYEFRTGKLHEHWHGKQEPESAEYADDVLAKAKTKTAGRDQASKNERGGQTKEDDRER